MAFDIIAKNSMNRINFNKDLVLIVAPILSNIIAYSDPVV